MYTTPKLMELDSAATSAMTLLHLVTLSAIEVLTNNALFLDQLFAALPVLSELNS